MKKKKKENETSKGSVCSKLSMAGELKITKSQSDVIQFAITNLIAEPNFRSFTAL